MMATHQAEFHRRWCHLQDPDVRALAWLLSAPDLLDWQAPCWRGKIARLPADPDLDAWLAAQDAASAALHDYLRVKPQMRVGRYAERLMAFYFEARGLLRAYNVQVQQGKTTVGEFDFLLQAGPTLLHWEFATKFYLCQPAAARGTDYFIGPSLADEFGHKIHKMLDRQLTLSRHPAAQVVLPQPVAGAQALIKGWLFYQRHAQSPVMLGLAADHCRGSWCAAHELTSAAGLDAVLGAGHFLILSRLQWLAPAQAALSTCLTRAALRQESSAYFRANRRPLLVAGLQPDGRSAFETARCFVVPDDWGQRAQQRIAAFEH